MRRQVVLLICYYDLVDSVDDAMVKVRVEQVVLVGGEHVRLDIPCSLAVVADVDPPAVAAPSSDARYRLGVVVAVPQRRGAKFRNRFFH